MLVCIEDTASLILCKKNYTTGTNLLQVTIHELGHALGLAHSPDVNSIMQPFYTGYNPNVRLGQDDIDGVLYLYGTLAILVTLANPSSCLCGAIIYLFIYLFVYSCIHLFIYFQLSI